MFSRGRADGSRVVYEVRIAALLMACSGRLLYYSIPRFVIVLEIVHQPIKSPCTVPHHFGRAVPRAFGLWLHNPPSSTAGRQRVCATVRSNISE